MKETNTNQLSILDAQQSVNTGTTGGVLKVSTPPPVFIRINIDKFQAGKKYINAFAAIVRTKRVVSNGVILQPELTLTKLSKKLGVSRTTASTYIKKYIPTWIREGWVRKNIKGDLILSSFNKDKLYKTIKVNVSGTLNDIKEDIRKQITVNKIRRCELKRRRANDGLPVNALQELTATPGETVRVSDKGVALSNRKIADLLCMSTGGVSDLKKRFNNVKWSAVKTYAGTMPVDDFKAFQKANRRRGEHIYQTVSGAVMIQSVTRAILIPRKNKGLHINNTPLSLTVSDYSTPPSVPVSNELLMYMEQIMMN